MDALGESSLARLSPEARATYADRRWLAARVAAGETSRQIAASVGRSLEAIYMWLRRFGLAPERVELPEPVRRRLTSRRWWWIQRQRRVPMADLAAELGCSPITLIRWRARSGVAPWPTTPRWKDRRALGRWLAGHWDALQFPPREKLVLRHYYGVRVPPEALEAIARRLGTSRQYADQVRQAALGRLLASRGDVELAAFADLATRRPRFPGKHERGRATYHDRAWLTARVRQGMSDADIARDAGVRSGTIGRARRSMGIRSRAWWERRRSAAGH